MAPFEKIGLYGGMALLISSITGPGLTTIPLLFQQAGWLTPTLALIVIAAISYGASLLLVETMASIPGNEVFVQNIEYSTIAQCYMGRKIHILMQIFLYCALQSVNVASIVISCQSIDSFFVGFWKTCALSFTQGGICVREVNPEGSPFDTYILGSFGTLVTLALVVSLSWMKLAQNIPIQLMSMGILAFVLGCWVYIFAESGLKEHIPTIGKSQENLIGFVLSNFSFVCSSIAICTILYLIIGLIGAASSVVGPSNVLATFSNLKRPKGFLLTIDILFPLAVLVTSVPVYAIVTQNNLERGGCPRWLAYALGTFLPWLLVVPLQTKDWLIPAMNWTSLVFGSTANFLVPLALYLYSRANPITEHPTTQLANMKSGSPSSTGSSQEISAPVSRPTGSEANVEANLEPQGSSPTLPGLSPAEKKILPLPQPNRHLPYPRNLEAEEEGIFMATNSRAFKAFPERLWWCTKVVASITLGLMLCAVLGSIILNTTTLAKNRSDTTQI